MRWISTVLSAQFRTVEGLWFGSISNQVSVTPWGLKPANSRQNFQRALMSQRGLWFKGLIRCWSSSLNQNDTFESVLPPMRMNTVLPLIVLHHTAYLVWKNIMWYKCGHIGHKWVLSVVFRMAVNMEWLGGWSARWLMPRSALSHAAVLCKQSRNRSNWLPPSLPLFSCDLLASHF